jgi:type IV pilus assembly protein PilX
MNNRRKTILERDPRGRRQQGAALVIGLILLLVLTILAVSGVMSSTLELRMVGNQQQQERAFQAAELAIEEAMSISNFSTNVGIAQTATAVDPDDDEAPDTYEWQLSYVAESSMPTVPTGFSLGAGFQAYHFVVSATGRSAGGAESAHTQGFYVVGPGG